MSKEGPRRDQGSTLFLEKISWGEKERSNFKLRLFGSKRINFIWFLFFRVYDLFLIVYYNLLLAGLTRQVLAQYQ